MPFVPLNAKGIPDFRRQSPEPPTYDAFKPYTIRALNEDYSGDIFGDKEFTFVSGVCTVQGLMADAYPDEIEERQRRLIWFWNADGTWKRHLDTEGKVRDRTWEPVYVIEEWVGRPRRLVTEPDPNDVFDSIEPEAAPARGKPRVAAEAS